MTGCGRSVCFKLWCVVMGHDDAFTVEDRVTLASGQCKVRLMVNGDHVVDVTRIRKPKRTWARHPGIDLIREVYVQFRWLALP